MALWATPQLALPPSRLELPHPQPQWLIGLQGAGWGLEVGAVSGNQQGLGTLPSLPLPRPVFFHLPPPLTLPLSSLHLLPVFSIASTAGCQPAHRVASAKSLLSAFAYQLRWAGLVPSAPTLNICFWLASRRYGNEDPPTLSLSSPGWRKGPHLAGVGKPG